MELQQYLHFPEHSNSPQLSDFSNCNVLVAMDAYDWPNCLSRFWMFRFHVSSSFLLLRDLSPTWGSSSIIPECSFSITIYCSSSITISWFLEITTRYFSWTKCKTFHDFLLVVHSYRYIDHYSWVCSFRFSHFDCCHLYSLHHRCRW